MIAFPRLASDWIITMRCNTWQQAQCRFKRPGQYWSQQGDEALLCLETFWRNNRWHLLFPHNRNLDPSKN
jgi:hypothetical protein